MKNNIFEFFKSYKNTTLDYLEYHKEIVGYFWLNQHEKNQISYIVNQCLIFETLNPRKVSNIDFGGNPLIQF